MRPITADIGFQRRAGQAERHRPPARHGIARKEQARLRIPQADAARGMARQPYHLQNSAAQVKARAVAYGIGAKACLQEGGQFQGMRKLHGEIAVAADVVIVRVGVDHAQRQRGAFAYRRAQVDPAGAGVNQKRAGVARHQKCPHLFHFNRPCAGSKRFDVIAVVHKSATPFRFALVTVPPYGVALAG